MPRYQIDPKYTYSGKVLTFPIPWLECKTQYSHQQDYLAASTKVIDPLWPVLDKYASSDYPSNARRSGSKVQMTSLRLKGTIHIHHKFLQQLVLRTDEFVYKDHAQLPSITYQFFNMRFLLIKWSPTFSGDSVDTYVRDWFVRSFVYYGAGGQVYNFDRVPSTHEKLMRMSTEYTGQFQILADKCFTLTSKHPSLDVDWVIPLRERLSWDPESADGEPTKPQQPRFSIVVLGPYNVYLDMDPTTRQIAMSNSKADIADADMNEFAIFQYILKMNYIDL